MKRILSLLLALCLVAGLGGVVMADETDQPSVSLRTSVYCDAASYSEMRYLFEDFDHASSLSSGVVTRAMLAAALGRYTGIDAQAGVGTGYAKADETCLREAPDSESAVLRRLSRRVVLTASGVYDGWYAVTADGVSGYIPCDQAEIYCDGYADLVYGEWYVPYMKWAENIGLIAAADGKLSPHAALTREELGNILTAYMDKLRYALPETNETYAFTDVASFAAGTEGAAILQKAGVMIENENGAYLPGEYVPISEAEGILLRFLPNLTTAFDFRLAPVASVEETDPVDDSWFDDACFIGHSQVVGMDYYFKLDNADYYAVVGHTAQQVIDHEYYELPDGSYGTLSEGLHMKSYGKVYIMLGINDCNGREDRLERFLAPMRQIIQLVQETQPDAQIYLLSLAPVGRATPNNLYYNPASVLEFTQAVKALSREFDTEYLDLFRLMCDEEGYFQVRFDAGDGIHIQANEYYVIKDYLKCHT